VLPLALALFVDHLHGTPIRSAAVLSALLWAAVVLVVHRRRPSCSPIWPAFLLWVLIGVTFSVDPSNTLNAWSLMAAAGAMAAGFSVLLSVVPEERRFLAPALLILGAMKAVIALAHADAGTANMSLLGMFWSVGLVVALPRQLGRAAAMWLSIVALNLFLMWRWNMSSAFLGLAVGIPLVAALRRSSWRWATAAGCVGVGVLLLFLVGPTWLRDNPNDPRRLNRLTIWKDSAVYARHHGLVGTGAGTFEQYYPAYKTLPDAETANDPHNEGLGLICEGGLPAFFMGLGMVGMLMAASLKRGASAAESSGGLAVLLVGAMVYYPLRSDALLFAAALLSADLLRPSSVPWMRSTVWGVSLVASTAALVAVTQGAAFVYEFRGGRAWNAGDTTHALVCFEHASRWNPLEARFLDHQVECLRRLDRKTETLPLLRRAVTLKPRDVWLRRKWAVATLVFSGPEAARAVYAPILALAPNVAQFRRENEELKTLK
jgi:hypothetical protein